MIKRVISIHRIGRFKEYQRPNGFPDFEKHTLVYSENARGKSTLACILRSLATGDCAPLIAKKTFGVSDASVIELLHEKGASKFDGATWNRLFSDIEVFDSTFVNNHVYSGATVEHEHKKRLHQFAIGSESVELAKEVVRLDGVGRALAAKISSAETEVEKHVVGTITVAKFLNLPTEENVDAKIQSSESRIAALEKAVDIGKQAFLAKISIPSTDGAIEALLSKTLETVSKQAEEATKQHVLAHLDDDGERWLKDGVEYLKGDACPFCGQAVAGLAIISSFKAYFDEAYADLKTEIATQSLSVTKSLSDASGVTLEQTVQTNDARCGFWKQYIPAEMPMVDAAAWKTVITECREAYLEHLERKQASPLEATDIRHELTEAVASLTTALEESGKYNAAVGTINEAITAKKKEVTTANLGIERLNLQNLKNAKVRHTEPVSILCEKLIKLNEEKEKVDGEKKTARDDLNDKTKALLKTYESRIKHHLGNFGATFSIAEVAQSNVGGQPSSSYQLVVEGCKVNLGDSKTPANEPCFKSVLSDGDKSTLAFAFFLARLDRDPNLKDKVVVFDDPISSLDGHRKHCTQQEICNIGRKAKQVIVCSHDPFFLRSIWDACPEKELLALHLVSDGGSSRFERWEIETATLSEFFKGCRMLKDVAAGKKPADPRNVLMMIRVVLEGHLRLRFPDSFRDDEWLGNFVEKITAADVSNPLVQVQPKLQELRDLKDYCKGSHHSSFGLAGLEPINEVTLQAYCHRAMQFILWA